MNQPETIIPAPPSRAEKWGYPWGRAVVCIWNEDGETCTSRDVVRRDLCEKHYRRGYYLRILERYPIPPEPPRPIGRWLNASGYVVTRLEEDGPTLVEHRVVMEAKLGRPLRRGENVHHINGVKHDNRPENLELWLTPQPPGQRPDEFRHCPGCRCGE